MADVADELDGGAGDVGARFLAEASHELRGGAARLALMAEALAERGLADGAAPPLEPHLRALAAEGRRVQALASELLDVARLAAEGRRVEPQAVAVSALVDDVVAGLAPRPGRDVVVQVADDVKAWADPLALDQVLSNLIGNALQHGGPRVTITGRVERARVVVQVCDDGPGLPPGWSGRLPSPPLPGPGGGLGLSIATQLVELLDGELAYDDGAGGARFTVRLPAA